MSKRKRKLTPAEKAEKKRRRKEYMTIYIGGKQRRVKRPPTINGMDVDEFIRRNADQIWLVQNEMCEYLTPPEEPPRLKSDPALAHQDSPNSANQRKSCKDDDIPF